MTKALSNTPLWPYIGVVCCLLILTLLSPRSWDNVEEDPVAAVESQSQATITAREIASPTPDDSAPYQASARIALNAENQKHEATNGVGGQATNELLSLAEFQTARRVANISPPVAERVEFDPSLDHAPSLPSPDPSPGIPRIEIAPRSLRLPR